MTYIPDMQRLVTFYGNLFRIFLSFYVFPVGTDVSGRAAYTFVIIATTSVEDSYSGRKAPWLVSDHYKIISLLYVKRLLAHGHFCNCVI